MENKYTKLSQLVGDKFTVEKVWGYKFKEWLPGEKRFRVEDKYFEGSRKVYEVDTDKGKLDLSAGQLGAILVAVFKNGEASLNGNSFSVKSNGKEGMDIRYFFDVAKSEPEVELNEEMPW